MRTISQFVNVTVVSVKDRQGGISWVLRLRCWCCSGICVVEAVEFVSSSITLSSRALSRAAVVSAFVFCNICR